VDVGDRAVPGRDVLAAKRAVVPGRVQVVLESHVVQMARPGAGVGLEAAVHLHGGQPVGGAVGVHELQELVLVVAAGLGLGPAHRQQRRREEAEEDGDGDALHERSFFAAWLMAVTSAGVELKTR
jgi:hypothetical protein